MWTASTPPTRASLPRARKLAKIAYEEMLELASVGAKVLQTRSVELAMKERVRVQVLSSFDDGSSLGGDLPGTLVVDEDEIVEKEIVSGHRLFARRGEGHGARACRTGRASPPPSSARSRPPPSMST